MAMLDLLLGLKPAFTSVAAARRREIMEIPNILKDFGLTGEYKNRKCSTRSEEGRVKYVMIRISVFSSLLYGLHADLLYVPP